LAMLQGLRYVCSNTQLRIIERDHSIHQRKLQNIHVNEKRIKTKAHEPNISAKVGQMHLTNMKFVNNERFNAIDKDNQLLLHKLVDISKKKSNYGFVKPTTRQGKSLHAPYRKKEMVRIATENEAFAKRLLKQNSTFNLKKIHTDYKKHQDLLNSMTKRASTSTLKMRESHQRLPPLKGDTKRDDSIIKDRRASLATEKALSISTQGMGIKISTTQFTSPVARENKTPQPQVTQNIEKRIEEDNKNDTLEDKTKTPLAASVQDSKEQEISQPQINETTTVEQEKAGNEQEKVSDEKKPETQPPVVADEANNKNDISLKTNEHENKITLF